MKFAAKSKLVMIGDSITDCGRAHPIAEGTEALGNGYVRLVNAFLMAVYPDLGVRVVNVGTSGQQVPHLAERWQRDVLDLRPDWVSVMIGTNDVWRQFDIPLQTERHTLPDEYERTLNALVERTRPTVKGMVLMTPFYIEPDANDAMRKRMDQYGTIVKQTAERHKTLLVDTQAAFDAALRHLPTQSLAGDRVHPNAAGHAILARAFLDAIGFDWTRRAG